MNKKRIELSFDLGQVCNDVLAKCNLVGESIRDAGLEDIKANVQEPDGPETRSIINRAVTEAFGAVKSACQRYLLSGRTEDDNRLERLVKSVTYAHVQKEDSDGHLLYNCKVSNVDTVVYTTDDGTTWKDELTDEAVTPDDTPTPWMVDGEITDIEYETVILVLEIPNFNVSVTDHLKSCIHKYVVDYVMGRFLQDQVADKAKEYKDEADAEDYAKIISALNARDKYTMRNPSFM